MWYYVSPQGVYKPVADAYKLAVECSTYYISLQRVFAPVE